MLFNAAVVLAALGIIGDLLAASGSCCSARSSASAAARLQADILPSHYEPGAAPTGQPPTTGANAGKTEEREAVKL